MTGEMWYPATVTGAAPAPPSRLRLLGRGIRTLFRRAPLSAFWGVVAALIVAMAVAMSLALAKTIAMAVGLMPLSMANALAMGLALALALALTCLP